jgi:Conjugal transfer protein TraD
MRLKTSELTDKQKATLEEKKLAVRQLENKLKLKRKKERTKKLTEIGSLAENAGISHLDGNVLLGAFLEVAENMNDPKKQALWKSKKLTSNDIQPVVINFKNLPPAELITKMKKIKINWNPIRKEYSGKADVSLLKELLKGAEHTIHIMNDSE